MNPLFDLTGKVAIIAAGRYEDELVKQGNRWLFKKRKIHMDLVGNMQ